MGRVVNPFASAESELEWYFASGDGAVGHRAQSYGGTGTGVFDEQASHRLHVARRRWEHQDALRKRAAAESVLWRLEPPEREVLVLAYTPRGWAWSDDLARLRVRAAFRRSGSNASLIALALEGEAIVEAMRRHAAGKPTTFDGRLEFLSWECKQARKKVYEPVRLDADRRLVGALQAYDAVMGARAQYAADRKAEARRAVITRHTRVMSSHAA